MTSQYNNQQSLIYKDDYLIRVTAVKEYFDEAKFNLYEGLNNKYPRNYYYYSLAFGFLFKAFLEGLYIYLVYVKKIPGVESVRWGDYKNYLDSNLKEEFNSIVTNCHVRFEYEAKFAPITDIKKEFSFWKNKVLSIFKELGVYDIVFE